MDLRRFRYFVACAEELHFTRAARRLGIAQPPLSQQIQVLEAEIGTRLFYRLSRGVELTPAGVSFLKDAKAVLELAERAMLSAQQIGRGERGSIRIGFTSSASFNPFVPGIISEYRLKYPGVSVTLSENTTAISLGELRDGRLDVAFLRPTSTETGGLRSKLLLKEEMMIALPARHPLAKAPKVPLALLADEPFILYPRVNGRALYDSIIAACRDSGFSPQVVQEAPQMASVVSLVAAGVGVAIVTSSMSQLQKQGVTYRVIDGTAPSADLCLMLKDGLASASVDKFVEMVRRAAEELDGETSSGTTSGSRHPRLELQAI